MSRILLVEDSKVQAIVATRILKAGGHSIQHVTTAEEALKACYDSAPDIVLQDQHLVEMSGLEVCRRIKNDMALANIPVLVLTAGNREKDHIAALDAGADAFLPKESPQDELLAVIARQIKAAAGTRVTDADNSSLESSQQTRILAVDDSDTFLEILCRRLTESGFRVAGASSGPEGLSMLQQQPFDVAIVDVVMPEMDGFQFCKNARQWANNNAVQLGLLVLTGSNREDVLVQALEAGADDYATKSQEMDVILAHTTALARRISRAIRMEALTERILNQQADRAASRAKRAVLADISQSLLAPINDIIAASRQLANGTPTDDQRTHLKSIQQSADSLLEILQQGSHSESGDAGNGRAT